MFLRELRADHPKNDEMLFHSGGPIGKTSRLSMIPMLDDLRVVFHQPENDTAPVDRNPLIGELDLRHTPLYFWNSRLDRVLVGQRHVMNLMCV